MPSEKFFPQNRAQSLSVIPLGWNTYDVHFFLYFLTPTCHYTNHVFFHILETPPPLSVWTSYVHCPMCVQNFGHPTSKRKSQLAEAVEEFVGVYICFWMHLLLNPHDHIDQSSATRTLVKTSHAELLLGKSWWLIYQGVSISIIYSINDIHDTWSITLGPLAVLRPCQCGWWPYILLDKQSVKYVFTAQ